MRALWIVAAIVGAIILIASHFSGVGIVIGLGFLALALFLYKRPLVHRIGLSHR
jgi:hypothetical protein